MCNAQDDQAAQNFPGRFSSLKKITRQQIMHNKISWNSKRFPLYKKITNPILKTTLVHINNRKLIETNKCNVSSRPIFYYEFSSILKTLKILS